MIDHLIDLPGIPNARELGGYAAGGKTIKNGLLIRTARIDQAEAEAVSILQNRYHLQTIVDFRMTEEKNLMPDPVIPGCENLFHSVMDLKEAIEGNPELIKKSGASPEKALAEIGKILSRYTDPGADRIALLNGMCESGILKTDIYQGFLLNERGKEAYRAIFKAVLELDSGRAVLWHCTDGKDRTGCAAMLLLFALGASRETVMEDYLITNKVNEKKLASARKSAEDCRLEGDRLDLLLFISGGAIESFMNKAIDTLIESYGSVEGYLKQELGVGKAELAELRARYLG